MSNYADSIANATFSPSTLASKIEALFNGSALYGGTSGGTANAHTLSVTGISGSYGTGQRVKFIAGATNTAATTLNINSIGAATIKGRDGSTDLTASAIISGTEYEVIYDGSNWRLLENISGVWTPTLTNVANVAASTSYQGSFIRVGNVCYCFGYVDIDATSTSTTTQLGLSLPIASNLANKQDLCGTFSNDATSAFQGGRIKADTTNDRAELQYFSGASVVNMGFTYHFGYRII